MNNSLNDSVNNSPNPATGKAVEVIAYTDGSCLRNPGVGGWGVYLPQGIDGTSASCELSGGVLETTNNRMELEAAIQALEATSHKLPLKIFTDSEYLSKGITEWLAGWKRRGWKTAARKPVENQDLWKRLDTLRHGRNITWQWVRAHNQNPGNERADALANQAAHQLARQKR